jgi:hypothetical protein
MRINLFLDKNKIGVQASDSSDTDSSDDEGYNDISFKVYNVKHLIMLKDCREIVTNLVRNLNRSKQIIYSDFSIYKDYLHEKLIEQNHPEVEGMCEIMKQVRFMNHYHIILLLSTVTELFAEFFKICNDSKLIYYSLFSMGY